MADTNGSPGTAGTANPPNLRISSLSKSFGGVRALDAVDLTVPAGQVHALLGHNGAGKSTLIKCLGGAFPPDSGTIEVGGVPHARLSPRESIAAGVAIIFQTLSVVDSLTVAENIFLGQEWTRYGRIDRRAQEKVAVELLDRVAASCSPRDRVGELPMGQKQLVEIAKALSRSASVLVLDEPTAALSGTESDALATRVEDLRTQGLAIVYVTHLLAEVERLADAVTVLRDGRVAHHTATGNHRRHDLVRAITGGRAAGPAAGATTAAGGGADVVVPGRRNPARPARLTVRGLRGPGFGPVDLTVAEGEIVGLYGLIGSGRTRVLETLFGRRRASGGSVRVGERAVSASRPADALAAGVALVPADRRAQGLFAGLSAQDNVLLPSVRTLARRGVRALGAERRVFGSLAESVGLRPVRPGLPASAFSGGNQQKLLLGRWINEARAVDVLLLDEPTQGVDVGARQEIYDVVSSLAAERGTAVLFASSDPEEAAVLAHRCLVVDRGRIVAELSGAGLTEESLLAAVHDAGPAAQGPDHSPDGDPSASPAPSHEGAA
ncbi:putative ABC transporter ATP binding protein [Streptomyces scabiei 87.22]|uniref:Putative ABC transporter ATP binding protein n=6 Tax=Streptomyces scabiei TaxID=1930 RepID=C9Z0E7_STRSW|nr:sugar ABC transporter ATP-binding protein [Streptomyces scabiei]MDX2578609.1 sugar ABC transporter ATP-binding protein [Streptomyces scabiei]MDX2655072.1 sugar ABC transporter ATP-binding protein [Streptomyces scabiei]MDX2720565.1 sugar ABC transporter ATP-binding protein [Streptomyces scabiei]MDX2868576.1 sugar ABC transporter ATP-binding protein [Streptomyces scabiei]MDX2885792.1 sugar ABC transporter ATP-binding protein [Streptomyces scabiei]